MIGLAPIRELEGFMRRVRQQWAEAKTEDSAAEPLLGTALEQLACVHAKILQACGGPDGVLTVGLEEALLDDKVMAGIKRRRRAQVGSSAAGEPHGYSGRSKASK